jgi:hypothetical protein
MALYTTNNRRLNAILHSSKGATYTTGLLTLLVVTVMIAFAIVPSYTSITDKISNNELKQVYLDELIAKRDAMDTLLAEYDSNEELINIFETTTYTRNNNELLVANIDNIATGNGISLISTSFDKVKGPTRDDLAVYPELLTQNFNLTFKGTPPFLLETLREFESFPIPIEFNNIIFSLKDDNNAIEAGDVVYSIDTDLTMNLSGVFYFWKEALQDEPIVE